MFIKKKTLSLHVCQIASGEIKISFNKSEKNLNTNCGSSCKSLKRFSEVAKYGSCTFKVLERVLWVQSAPRPHET